VPENPSILHVVGRTADGQLWHTMRSPSGWTQFSNVIFDSGLLSQFGHVVDVACSRRLAACRCLPTSSKLGQARMSASLPRWHALESC
jgi:hypothetical protein